MMQQIRVCYVAPFGTSVKVGGGEIYLLELHKSLKELLKEYYEAYLISCKKSKYMKTYLIKLKNIHSPVASYVTFSIASFFKLKKIIRRNKINIINVHGGYGIGAILSKYSNGFPKLSILSTAHGTLIGWFKRLKTMKIPSLENMDILCALEREAFYQSDRVISVSDHVTQELTKYYKIKRSKIETLYSGVNLNFFSSSSNNKFRKKHKLLNKAIILFVGRLTRWKGVLDLIKALSLVKKDIPNVVLIVVGREYDLSKQLIYSYAEKYDVANYVKVIGWVSRKKLPEVYASADVVAIPSYYEGLPLVALEALASGKPIVATEVVGIPEILKGSRAGIIIKAGDEKDLARGLVHFLTLRNDEKKVVQLEARKIAQRYSWDILAKKVLKVYQEVIE